MTISLPTIFQISLVDSLDFFEWAQGQSGTGESQAGCLVKEAGVCILAAISNKPLGGIHSMKTIKQKVGALIAFTVLLFINPINSQAQQTVNGFDYVPYYFHDYYVYTSDFGYQVDYDVFMDYLPDANNIYQITKVGDGSHTVHVYQVRRNGVYELSYFSHGNSTTDFRYHPDSMDQQESLILPARLTIGDVFKTGYRRQQSVLVYDILPTFTVYGRTYQDVVILSEKTDTSINTYYLAPRVGLIRVNNYTSEDLNITLQLEGAERW